MLYMWIEIRHKKFSYSYKIMRKKMGIRIKFETITFIKTYTETSSIY
jgi:hypothetical protein